MRTTMEVCENDGIADLLRERFAEQSTLVLDLISSPGSGKTSLIEATVRALGKDYRMGALTGGVATEPRPAHGFDHSLRLTVPPLGCLFLKRR